MTPTTRVILAVSLALGLNAPLAARIKRGLPDPYFKAMSPTVAAMHKADCFVCHSVAHKVVGPAFQSVAARYGCSEKAVEHLTAKIEAGGAGHWGHIKMATHKHVKAAQLKQMVAWILGCDHT